MHEFLLINDLMRKISDIARANRASRVARVTVTLGALAHISADHFREHFEHAARGMEAEGAELEIELGPSDDPRAQDILLQSVELVDPAE
jgi:hydrogenase nickel incorporation protein HypA/HybF